MGKQISDWRAGFGKKTFRYGMTFRIWKKKIVSLSYFLFVGSCFKERNRFGADFFQKNFSFCRKRVPEGQFPSPRMTFPFKGRPIDFVFFFPASTEKASRLPAGESSNDLCLSVTKTFRYESGKIVLLYYFLTMLWIISNSALPFTASRWRTWDQDFFIDVHASKKPEETELIPALGQGRGKPPKDISSIALPRAALGITKEKKTAQAPVTGSDHVHENTAVRIPRCYKTI